MKSLMMIDTHTHYSLKCFDSIRAELLNEMKDKGICSVIEAGIDFSLNQRIVEFCGQYNLMYAALGVHPKYVAKLDDVKFTQIKKMLDENEKIIAIGETGLDFYHCKDETTKALQKKWFHNFIALAIHRSMPMVIHCRDAYPDLIKILSGYHFPSKPGTIHCFSGTLDEAKTLIDLGFYLGIGGKFIRDNSKELEDVIKAIPLEAIVLETDAPYLSPISEEKINTSMNLGFIAEELAKIKDVTRDELLGITFQNTYKLYPNLIYL